MILISLLVVILCFLQEKSFPLCLICIFCYSFTLHFICSRLSSLSQFCISSSSSFFAALAVSSSIHWNCTIYTGTIYFQVRQIKICFRLFFLLFSCLHMLLHSNCSRQFTHFIFLTVHISYSYNLILFNIISYHHSLTWLHFTFFTNMLCTNCRCPSLNLSHLISSHNKLTPPDFLLKCLMSYPNSCYPPWQWCFCVTRYLRQRPYALAPCNWARFLLLGSDIPQRGSSRWLCYRSILWCRWVVKFLDFSFLINLLCLKPILNFFLRFLSFKSFFLQLFIHQGTVCAMANALGMATIGVRNINTFLIFNSFIFHLIHYIFQVALPLILNSNGLFHYIMFWIYKWNEFYFF